MDKIALLLAAIALAGCSQSSEAKLRKQLAATTGRIALPAGTIDIDQEIAIPDNAHDMEIVGDHTTLRASAKFKGRAILVADHATSIHIHGITFTAAPELRVKPLDMAPPENAFRVYYPNNALLFDQSTGIKLTELTFASIPNFAVIVSRSSNIEIDRVSVSESGSRNTKRRNNLTGGIVIEEGSSDFTVRNSTFTNIIGNGLWTHSLYSSPRLKHGIFEGNSFTTIGRDALQAGHVEDLAIINNTGSKIGWPYEAVDIENGGTPVAIDTAGNVSNSRYEGNHFEEINGKCFDLDGFHDGAVRANTCTNRSAVSDYPHGHFGLVMNNTNPDMKAQNITIEDNTFDGVKYGAIFLMGSGHRVANNRFLNINLARCNESSPQCVYKADEPEMLQSGIYLGTGVARMEETRANMIENNTITGHKMSTRCIAFAPKVSPAANTARKNDCRDVILDVHAH